MWQVNRARAVFSLALARANTTITAARLRRAVDQAGIDVARERPNPEARYERAKETRFLWPPDQIEQACRSLDDVVGGASDVKSAFVRLPRYSLRKHA